MDQFEIWRTVTIGTFKTVEGMKLALKGKKSLDYVADAMIAGVTSGPGGFEKFELRQAEEKVDLVSLILSPNWEKEPDRTKYLFPETHPCTGARFAQICEQGIKRGLHLCRPEVALAVNYYSEAKAGHMHWFAMTPLQDGDYNPRIFRLSRDDKYAKPRALVSGAPGFAEYAWSGGCQFVFEQPRR